MSDKEEKSFWRIISAFAIGVGLMGGLHYFSIGNIAMGYWGLGLAIFWALMFYGASKK
jgi:hypothetical protein